MAHLNLVPGQSKILPCKAFVSLSVASAQVSCQGSRVSFQVRNHIAQAPGFPIYVVGESSATSNRALSPRLQPSLSS